MSISKLWKELVISTHLGKEVGVDNEGVKGALYNGRLWFKDRFSTVRNILFWCNLVNELVKHVSC